MFRSNRSCIHPAMATATRRSWFKVAFNRMSMHSKCVAHKDDSNHTAPNLYTHQMCPTMSAENNHTITVSYWYERSPQLASHNFEVAIGMKEHKYSTEDALLMSFIFPMQSLAICSSAGPSVLLSSSRPTSVIPWRWQRQVHHHSKFACPLATSSKVA